jgi:hypothetical protein
LQDDYDNSEGDVEQDLEEDSPSSFKPASKTPEQLKQGIEAARRRGGYAFSDASFQLQLALLQHKRACSASNAIAQALIEVVSAYEESAAERLETQGGAGAASFWVLSNIVGVLGTAAGTVGLATPQQQLLLDDCLQQCVARLKEAMHVSQIRSIVQGMEGAMPKGSSEQQQDEQMQRLLQLLKKALEIFSASKQQGRDLQSLHYMLQSVSQMYQKARNTSKQHCSALLRQWFQLQFRQLLLQLSDAVGTCITSSAASGEVGLDKLAQAAAGTLEVCALLRVCPAELLEAVAQLHDQKKLLDCLSIYQVGMFAQALGQLGERNLKLLEALSSSAERKFQQQQLLQQQPSRSQRRSVLQLLWAHAELGVSEKASWVQELATQQLQVVRGNAAAWDAVRGYERRLITYIDAWLTDERVGGDGSNGLAAALTAEQLQECYKSLIEQLEMRKEQLIKEPTYFQLGVAGGVELLPFVREGSVQQEQIVGVVLADAVAETVDGRKLAVEADGSHHFRHPDGQLTGSTLYRNRALQARGYIVVSVPYAEWCNCAPGEQQALLQRLVEQAMSSASE